MWNPSRHQCSYIFDVSYGINFESTDIRRNPLTQNNKFSLVICSYEHNIECGWKASKGSTPSLAYLHKHI